MRAAVALLPELYRLDLYSIFSETMPSFTPTSLGASENMIVAKQLDREIYFPRPLPMVKYSHIIYGYEELLHRKYTLPGFVQVEPGDIVIDCGAYVGGFSLSAAKIASAVHVFEPDGENFACLKRNLSCHDNVHFNCAGLYSETRRMKLNVSASSVEHSLLEPDDGSIVRVQEIDVMRIDDYVRMENVDRIDFVKVEAEGVEVEVFEGLGELKARKLAIDVSPERNGLSPAEDFWNILRDLGYEIQQRRNVLFARLPA